MGMAMPFDMSALGVLRDQALEGLARSPAQALPEERPKPAVPIGGRYRLDVLKLLQGDVRPVEAALTGRLLLDDRGRLFGDRPCDRNAGIGAGRDSSGGDGRAADAMGA